MKHWTISYKPLSQIWDNLKILVSFNLPIIYTSLCTEKIQADLKSIAVFNDVSWKIFLIYTCSQLESYTLLFWEKQQHEAMSSTLELSCVCHLRAVQILCKVSRITYGFQNMKQRHTHYIYKYLNTCNKNKRQVKMSTTLTVISLAHGLA